MFQFLKTVGLFESRSNKAPHIVFVAMSLKICFKVQFHKCQLIGNTETEHVTYHCSDTLARSSPSGILKGKWNNYKLKKKSEEKGGWLSNFGERMCHRWCHGLSSVSYQEALTAGCLLFGDTNIGRPVGSSAVILIHSL